MHRGIPERLLSYLDPGSLIRIDLIDYNRVKFPVLLDLDHTRLILARAIKISTTSNGNQFFETAFFEPFINYFPAPHH